MSQKPNILDAYGLYRTMQKYKIDSNNIVFINYVKNNPEEEKFIKDKISDIFVFQNDIIFDSYLPAIKELGKLHEYKEFVDNLMKERMIRMIIE